MQRPPLRLNRPAPRRPPAIATNGGVGGDSDSASAGMIDSPSMMVHGEGGGSGNNGSNGGGSSSTTSLASLNAAAAAMLHNGNSHTSSLPRRVKTVIGLKAMITEADESAPKTFYPLPSPSPMHASSNNTFGFGGGGNNVLSPQGGWLPSSSPSNAGGSNMSQLNTPTNNLISPFARSKTQNVLTPTNGGDTTRRKPIIPVAVNEEEEEDGDDEEEDDEEKENEKGSESIQITHIPQNTNQQQQPQQYHPDLFTRVDSTPFIPSPLPLPMLITARNGGAPTRSNSTLGFGDPNNTDTRNPLSRYASPAHHQYAQNGQSNLAGMNALSPSNTFTNLLAVGQTQQQLQQQQIHDGMPNVVVEPDSNLPQQSSSPFAPLPPSASSLLTPNKKKQIPNPRPLSILKRAHVRTPVDEQPIEDAPCVEYEAPALVIVPPPSRFSLIHSVQVQPVTLPELPTIPRTRPRDTDGKKRVCEETLPALVAINLLNTKPIYKPALPTLLAWNLWIAFWLFSYLGCVVLHVLHITVNKRISFGQNSTQYNYVIHGLEAVTLFGIVPWKYWWTKSLFAWKEKETEKEMRERKLRQAAAVEKAKTEKGGGSNRSNSIEIITHAATTSDSTTSTSTLDVHNQKGRSTLAFNHLEPIQLLLITTLVGVSGGMVFYGIDAEILMSNIWTIGFLSFVWVSTFFAFLCTVLVQIICVVRESYSIYYQLLREYTKAMTVLYVYEQTHIVFHDVYRISLQESEREVGKLTKKLKKATDELERELRNPRHDIVVGDTLLFEDHQVLNKAHALLQTQFDELSQSKQDLLQSLQQQQKLENELRESMRLQRQEHALAIQQLKNTHAKYETKELVEVLKGHVVGGGETMPGTPGEKSASNPASSSSTSATSSTTTPNTAPAPLKEPFLTTLKSHADSLASLRASVQDLGGSSIQPQLLKLATLHAESLDQLQKQSEAERLHIIADHTFRFRALEDKHRALQLVHAAFREREDRDARDPTTAVAARKERDVAFAEQERLKKETLAAKAELQQMEEVVVLLETMLDSYEDVRSEQQDGGVQQKGGVKKAKHQAKKASVQLHQQMYAAMQRVQELEEDANDKGEKVEESKELPPQNTTATIVNTLRPSQQRQQLASSDFPSSPSPHNRNQSVSHHLVHHSHHNVDSLTSRFAPIPITSRLYQPLAPMPQIGQTPRDGRASGVIVVQNVPDRSAFAAAIVGKKSPVTAARSLRSPVLGGSHSNTRPTTASEEPPPSGAAFDPYAFRATRGMTATSRMAMLQARRVQSSELATAGLTITRQ